MPWFNGRPGLPGSGALSVLMLAFGWSGEFRAAGADAVQDGDACLRDCDGVYTQGSGALICDTCHLPTPEM